MIYTNSTKLFSIYIRNTLKLPINLDRHKLNSIGRESVINQKNNNTALRSLKIPHLIDGTDIEGELKLTYIDNLKDIEIKQWIDEFKYAKTIKKWNEKQSITIIKTLLNPKLHYIIENQSKTEVCMTKLLHTQFPEDDASYYLKLAKSHKQQAFSVIEIYKKAICQDVEKYGLCKGLSEDEIIAKQEEIFIENLHEDVNIEMNKLGKRTMEEIFTLINSAEIRIITNRRNIEIQQPTHITQNKATATHNTKPNSQHRKYSYQILDRNTPQINLGNLC